MTRNKMVLAALGLAACAGFCWDAGQANADLGPVDASVSASSGGRVVHVGELPRMQRTLTHARTLDGRTIDLSQTRYGRPRAGCSTGEFDACGECVYSNTVQETTVDVTGFPAGVTAICDDLTLAASTTERNLCRFELLVFGDAPGAAFSVTAAIWNNRPCEAGSTKLAEGTVTDIPNDSQAYFLNFVIDPPVTMSNTVWLEVKGTPLSEILIVIGDNTTDLNDMGTTEDNLLAPGFGGDPCPDVNFFNPDEPYPYAGLWIEMEATTSDPHPCCDLMTGQCTVVPPTQCAGQTQRFFPTIAACANIPAGQCTACAAVTPSGTAEGEANCANPDTVNAGCNATPPVFGTIACGQTLNGTAGTFTSGEDQLRDLDWFQFTVNSATTISVNAQAEFNFQVLLFKPSPDCNNAVGSQLGTGAACQPLTTDPECIPAGTYYLVIGPSVFSGVPCTAKWKMTLTCSGACTVPTGACCNGANCTTVDEWACAALSEDAEYQGDGVACGPDTCSEPVPCATCGGDTDGNSTVNFADLNSFVNGMLTKGNTCADVNTDGAIDGRDIRPFIQKITASGGTPCGGGGGGSALERCDANGQCPIVAGQNTFCFYQVRESSPANTCVTGGQVAAFELICVTSTCTSSPTDCGTSGQPTTFTIPGSSNCQFTATILADDCVDCNNFGATKRFRRVP